MGHITRVDQDLTKRHSVTIDYGFGQDNVSTGMMLLTNGRRLVVTCMSRQRLILRSAGTYSVECSLPLVYAVTLNNGFILFQICINLDLSDETIQSGEKERADLSGHSRRGYLVFSSVQSAADHALFKNKQITPAPGSTDGRG